MKSILFHQRRKAANGFFPFYLLAAFYQLFSPYPSTAQTLSAFLETMPGTSVKFEIIPLPAGTITINKTTVEIKPIWIGKTEVTWDEYDIYAFTLVASENQEIDELDAIARPTKPYGAPDRGFGHRGYPALSMTFHAAQEYCRWLSAKTGKKYRLPTEAEWNYGGENSMRAVRATNAHLEHDGSATSQEQMVALGCAGCGLSRSVRAMISKMSFRRHLFHSNSAQAYEYLCCVIFRSGNFDCVAGSNTAGSPVCAL
jgi:hypothetical protein